MMAIKIAISTMKINISPARVDLSVNSWKKFCGKRATIPIIIISEVPLPKQIADNLKQNNGFIPGVKPGQPTADYIGTIMDRITLPGAVLLAFVGILPGIAQLLGVTQGFATFFGGTSLLIMVGVILDTLQQIETQLLMRQYDGLMKSGRIQGRQVTQASY
jgi:preprotein translocase subunit SecY